MPFIILINKKMKKVTRVAIAKFKFNKPYYLLNPDQKDEVLWELNVRRLAAEQKKKVLYQVILIDGTEHGKYDKYQLEKIFGILFGSLRQYIGSGKRFKGLYYIKRYKP